MPEDGIHFNLQWTNACFLSMARIDFVSQLRALGYDIQGLANNFVVFEYVIPVGRFSGQVVKIAFQLDNAFPMNPPAGGPHFNTQLLQKSGGGGTHPYGAIHDSPLGPEWQYWSRPFMHWNKTDKTARTYMAHIRNLLATIP